MEAILSEVKGNNIIEVHYDIDPENPRTWENAGTMVYKYRGYGENEGDIDWDEFSSFEDFTTYLKVEKKAVIVLPLRVYDHSGLSMYVGTTGDRWDSSQVGAIYITQEDINNHWGAEYSIEDVEAGLRYEVDAYDHYLKGEVYGYLIFASKTCDTCQHTEREVVDSCWGYYSVEDALQTAKDYVLA